MTFLGLLGVVAVLFVAVVLATRDDEVLLPAERDRPDVALPDDSDVQPEDVAALRLPVAVRGYRMSEVDQVLDRLTQELALRDARLAALEGAGSDAGQPTAAAPPREPAEDPLLDAPVLREEPIAAPDLGTGDVAAAAGGDAAWSGPAATTLPAAASPGLWPPAPAGAEPVSDAPVHDEPVHDEPAPTADAEPGHPAPAAAAEPAAAADQPAAHRLVDGEPPHGDPLLGSRAHLEAQPAPPSSSDGGGAGAAAAPADPEPPHGDPFFPAVAPPDYEDDPEAGVHDADGRHHETDDASGEDEPRLRG